MKHSFDDFIQQISNKRGEKSSNNLIPLLHSFGNPNKAFPSIHIAGTNGKGSVSCKIAKGLQLAGKKVGLFTSPHITSFCERIQINGKCISEEEVLFFAKKIESFQVTFFEMAFVMACLYFAEHKVDYAVIETGIGGRLDTTNCLRSILSVITSIGYDHKAILGNTLEQIAMEKAGIIKPGHTVFLGATAHYPCMYNKDWKTLCMPQQHDYEKENNILADAVLRFMNISETIRKKAIEASMPCRFEQRGDWIFDIAHNPSGIAALLQRFEGKATFYIGFSKSKEIDTCIQYLLPRAHECILLPTNRSDMVSPNMLIPYVEKYSFPATLEEVLVLSEKKTPPHVVCGSAYIMEPLRSLLLQRLIE